MIRSLNIDDVFAMSVEHVGFDNVQDLQERFTVCYEERNEEEARRQLQNVVHLLEKDPNKAEDLGLFVSASCVTCGVLSSDCCELAGAILDIMSRKGLPKEVFAGMKNESVTKIRVLGLSDGCSALMETATLPEMIQIMSPTLKALSQTVERIERKRERFCVISLQLVCNWVARFQDRLDEIDETVDMLPVSRVVQFGRKLFSCLQVHEFPLPLAFILRGLNSFLSVLLCADFLLELSLPSLQQSVRETIGPYLTSSKIPMLSVTNLVDLVFEEWNRLLDAYADVSNDRSLLVTEFHRACGLLLWASFKFPEIPKCFKGERECILKLLEMESTLRNVPCILAVMDLVPHFTRTNPVDDFFPFWKRICLLLVHHMDAYSIVKIKERALKTIEEDILKDCREEIRWELLKELVMVPQSDIAALMVQHLRASVVNAWNEKNFHSKFTSVEVLKIVRSLLARSKDDSEISEHAELYSAALNLCLFLVVRASKKEEPARNAFVEYFGYLKEWIEALDIEIKPLLEEQPEDMRLARLKFAMDRFRQSLDDFEAKSD